MRNRNLETRNEGTVRGTPAKSKIQKKTSAMRESREIVFHAKQKLIVPRRNLAASASTKANVEKATLSVKPLARHQRHRSRRRDLVDRFPRKGGTHRGVSPNGRIFHKMCHKSLMETCTDASCNYRYPLRVSTAQNQRRLQLRRQVCCSTFTEDPTAKQKMEKGLGTWKRLHR